MAKPVVAFVSEHCCIRVVKEAIALKALGYSVRLIAGNPRSKQIFDTVSEYSDPHQLEEIVKSMAPAIDIWHIHNEPNWPASVVRCSVPVNAKVILDMHDSNYWRVPVDELSPIARCKMSWPREDMAVEDCGGFVVPSNACKAELEKRCGDKPVAVLPPAVPLGQYRYTETAITGGLVSQGGHALPDTKGLSGEHWRDYTALYAALKGKYPVYVYSPSFTYNPEDPMDKHYKSLGVMMGKFHYDELLDKLSSHFWNLVGNFHPNQGKMWVWDYAMPNKFFDAVAAGVPSVVFNCTEVKKVVEEYGIGIYVNSPEEFLAQVDDHQKYRSKLFKVRKELCLEKFIHSLTELYDEVLG